MLLIILTLNMSCFADGSRLATAYKTVHSLIHQVCTHRFAKPIAIGLAVTAVVGGAGYLVKRDYNRIRKKELAEFFLPKGLVAFGSINVPGWL